MRFRSSSSILILVILAALAGCGRAGPSPTATLPPTIPALPTITMPPPATATEPPPAATATASPAPASSATPAGQAPAISLPPGTSLTLSSLHMLSALQGWAVGGKSGGQDDLLLRTADGGSTWQVVNPPASIAPGSGAGMHLTAFFLDTLQAWAAYVYTQPVAGANPAVVWRTSDGGQTWTMSGLLPLQTDIDIYQPGQIYFADAHNGWQLAHLGAGMGHDYIDVFHTADGGMTWERVVDPDQENLPMSCSKTGLAFVDPQHGWVSGDCHGLTPGVYLYHTDDGGLTWQPVTLPAPNAVPDLFTNPADLCAAQPPAFISSTDGAILVSCTLNPSGQVRDWLYVSADGGATWLARALPAGGGRVQVSTGGLGWYIGGGGFYRTQDGGKGWELLSRVAWEGQPDFIDANTGWVIAQSTTASALVKGQDGGRHWQKIKPVIAP